jgi:hypothetical protein
MSGLLLVFLVDEGGISLGLVSLVLRFQLALSDRPLITVFSVLRNSFKLVCTLTLQEDRLASIATKIIAPKVVILVPLKLSDLFVYLTLNKRWSPCLFRCLFVDLFLGLRNPIVVIGSQVFFRLLLLYGIVKR